MNENHIATAEAYYRAWDENNIASMEKYLHPDVHFLSPLAEANGKEAILEALKRGRAHFKNLKLRAKFGSKDQTMLVYDLECLPPVGKCRSAVLMTFLDGLIAKIELFFDTRDMSGLNIWPK